MFLTNLTALPILRFGGLKGGVCSDFDHELGRAFFLFFLRSQQFFFIPGLCLRTNLRREKTVGLDIFFSLLDSDF